MKASSTHAKASKGFTLIEVMLVVVLVGLMVSAVQFTFQNNQSEQLLEKESLRFLGTFDIAAEYGMLNNVELGLFIEENTYQFLGYDGIKWTPLPNNESLSTKTLPDGMEILLTLDDLPIEEPPLFDLNTFMSDEDDNEIKGSKKSLNPQVLILSGGDISPFSLTFYMEDEFSDDEAVAYRVVGLYNPPLKLLGPITEFERAK